MVVRAFLDYLLGWRRGVLQNWSGQGLRWNKDGAIKSLFASNYEVNRGRINSQVAHSGKRLGLPFTNTQRSRYVNNNTYRTIAFVHLFWCSRNVKITER